MGVGRRTEAWLCAVKLLVVSSERNRQIGKRWSINIGMDLRSISLKQRPCAGHFDRLSNGAQREGHVHAGHCVDRDRDVPALIRPKPLLRNLESVGSGNDVSKRVITG